MKILILLLSTILAACNPAQGVASLPIEPPTPPIGPEQPENPSSSNKMTITFGTHTFTATLFNNASATAFKALLPLTLNMSDFNSNEKVASLPRSLTTSASNPATIYTGDIMLYGSSSLVLFYETFSTSYSYTRIGKVDNPSGLKTALGRGDVTIKFESQ